MVAEMELKAPKKITLEQRKAMLEFLQENKDLCKINGQLSQRQKEQLWFELAKQLNSVEGGVTKNWKQWQRSWQDWKFDTKKKMQEIKAETDAGGSCNRTINYIEEQLLIFLGCKQIEEHKESKDPIKENTSSDEAETLKDGSILIPIIPNEEESSPPPKKRKVSKSKCAVCTSKEDELLHASLICSERMATATESHSTALERMAAALEKQSDAFQKQTSTLQQMCSLMEIMLQKFPRNSNNTIV